MSACIANDLMQIIHRGLPGEDPAPVTPFRVIYQGGKVSVRHYSARGRPHPTPIILVYALIKRPFILDLQPGNSVVENLVGQGFEVFLLDWLPPTATDRWRGFEPYIKQDLAHAVNAVKIQQGVERVSIVGYCLGALLSVIYAALFPADVKALVTLALPLEMRTRGLSEQVFGWLDEQTIANMTLVYGNCPAWLLRNLFATMTLIHWVGQCFGVYPENESERYAIMFPALRHWLRSEVPVAGRLFRELAVDVFKKNLLARGRLMLGGERVDLKRIAAPLLNVVAERDVLVPPGSSLPLLELTGSNDKTNLNFPAGHIGVAVSDEAHAVLWPRIGAWLIQHER